MKRLVIAALVLIPVVAISYWALACPCDRTPGLYLRGVEASERVTDWSFANQVPLCQVQVNRGVLPHALNLNCWANSKGDLFLGCANCETKRWSAAALVNNQARVRLGTTVYPVTLTRVLDRSGAGPGLGVASGQDEEWERTPACRMVDVPRRVPLGSR